MPKFYEEAELKRLQACELGILKDFMKICDENGLQYFGFAGTGIGAIRHKGFIPWDDDIDIAMPRADFERFLTLVEEQMGDRYYVLNTERYENFPLMTTRLCIRGTCFVEPAFMEVDCPFGIFLDLYPYDNLADGKLAYTIQVWSAWFWSKVLILRNIPRPVLFQSGAKAAVIRAVCAAMHGLLCLFHVPKRWIYNRCKKACTRYNGRKTRRFGFPADTNPHWNTLEKEQALPPEKWEFEGLLLNFPRDIRAMLEHFYGDTYMELPPVEKRKTHFPYLLDFGDGKRLENPEYAAKEGANT